MANKFVFIWQININGMQDNIDEITYILLISVIFTSEKYQKCYFRVAQSVKWFVFV